MKIKKYIKKISNEVMDNFPLDKHLGKDYIVDIHSPSLVILANGGIFLWKKNK